MERPILDVDAHSGSFCIVLKRVNCIIQKKKLGKKILYLFLVGNINDIRLDATVIECKLEVKYQEIISKTSHEQAYVFR